MMAVAVKVFFPIEPDEDGYPSVAVESLWASQGEHAGEFVIDNVPFFVREATIGDTVSAREEEGVFWFGRLLRSSGNSLLRVVFFDQGVVDPVNQRLRDLGCSTEYLRAHNLLAVTVPTAVKLADVQRYLRTESDAGRIDYEEPLLRQ